jgi:hypothetical protein
MENKTASVPVTKKDITKAYQKDIKSYLGDLGKKVLDKQVDKDKSVTILGLLKSVPLALMQQYVFRQGWKSEVNTHLAKDVQLSATNKPIASAVATFVGSATVGGFSLAAMLGFALVGGAVPLVPIIAGSVVGAVGGLTSLKMAWDERHFLKAQYEAGSEAAAKSSTLNVPNIEPKVSEPAKDNAAEQAFKKLQELQEKLDNCQEKKSFVSNLNAKIEREEEMQDAIRAG